MSLTSWTDDDEIEGEREECGRVLRATFFPLGDFLWFPFPICEAKT